MKKFLLSALAILSCLAFSSCATYNNDKSINDLQKHMIKETKMRYACEMEPGPVHAESGFSIFTPSGHQVAFYKYNLNRKKMREKLERIKEAKCVYIAGIKFPAAINGSFIMIDYETKEKEKLLDAFYDF